MVTQTDRKSRRKRALWTLGGVLAICSGVWFAWYQGWLDPDDHELVQVALSESQDDLSQVKAVIAVFDEQTELKQTGWRRRHGPWRYALGEYTGALEGIMGRDPASPAARLAALWITKRDVSERARRAIVLLRKHHLLTTPSSILSHRPFKEAGEFLIEQIDRHEDEALRASAQLALAKRHFRYADAARSASEILALDSDAQEDEALFHGGIESVRLAAELDPEKEHEAGIALIRKLDTISEGLLPPEEAKDLQELILEHLTLGVGAVAPEIVGKNLDGNEMRLSDFRGKVVVLDFWADW